MRSTAKRHAWLTAATLFAVSIFSAQSALAQFGKFGQAPGASTAAEANLTLSVFGGFSEIKPDAANLYNTYGKGFVFGGDATRRFKHFDIALEPRFGKNYNPDAKESYFFANGRISRDYGRFHPYGIGGIGYGTVLYGSKHTDNSTLFVAGAGLEYDIASHWAARADWQYQYWNVGHETDGYNPNGITVAAVYRFRFGKYTRRR